MDRRVSRRQVLNAIVASGAALAVAPYVHAEPHWPRKPIKLVVPYPPGGATDIVTRVTAERLGAQLGQTVIVENRPGAGGNIGAEAVARAPGDGYSLLVATTAHAINKSLFKNLNYDILDDFVPVSLLTKGPLVLVVNPDFEAQNVAELIAMAKAQPDSIAYASSGNGQSTHMAAELFSSIAGIQMRHIPYKGSAPALNDVVAGQVPMMFDALLSCMPFVKAGRLRAIAVTGAERAEILPDVPTVAEAGLDDFQIYAWYGLLAPAGTPAEIVERLSMELKAALSHERVQRILREQGLTSAWDSLANTRKYLEEEVTKWGSVVRTSGATIG